jgi:stearoyl-CoA desaturase (Delta-9 desaturase)
MGVFMLPAPTPRSEAIPRKLGNFCFASFFSAFLYPALGVVALTTAIVAGIVAPAIELHWWMAPMALGVIALTIFLCNLGIGPLHRILQHRAGQLTAPAQVIVMINLFLAMQGSVTTWVNYHSRHHRFSDKPGDPHNPFESKRWAWTGWLIWRDWNDLKKPMANWLQDMPVIRILDKGYDVLTLALHLVVPAIIYLIVWAAGGSLVLTMFIHACIVIGRAIQFHATTLGVNVFGHLNVPTWFTHFMALLTGGEAFHDHHHDEPQSALHRPIKGVWNRIVDYNGTILLFYEKIGWVKGLKIAPQFLPAPRPV